MFLIISLNSGLPKCFRSLRSVSDFFIKSETSNQGVCSEASKVYKSDLRAVGLQSDLRLTPGTATPMMSTLASDPLAFVKDYRHCIQRASRRTFRSESRAPTGSVWVSPHLSPPPSSPPWHCPSSGTLRPLGETAGGLSKRDARKS